MDYKEMTRVTAWVFKNVKFLAGTDARVYVTILTRSSFKESAWGEGDDFLARELDLTKQQVSKSIRRLVKAGLITRMEPATGRLPASYKLRNEKDLKMIYENEELNPEWKLWNEEHDKLFFQLETEHANIGGDCPECASGSGERGKLCPTHQAELERFERRTEYRAMLIWERDHPKPESKRITVVKIALE